MIYSEYFQKYKGPNLTKAPFNNVYDITEKIMDLYGEGNNWQGKLWKYKEILGNECIGDKFYCEFHSEDGRKHWFNGMIGEPSQFFNPPLAQPFNQNLIS